MMGVWDVCFTFVFGLAFVVGIMAFVVYYVFLIQDMYDDMKTFNSKSDVRKAFIPFYRWHKMFADKYNKLED